jgi:hypothetical protein
LGDTLEGAYTYRSDFSARGGLLRVSPERCAKIAGYPSFNSRALLARFSRMSSCCSCARGALGSARGLGLASARKVDQHAMLAIGIAGTCPGGLVSGERH